MLNRESAPAGGMPARVGEFSTPNPAPAALAAAPVLLYSGRWVGRLELDWVAESAARLTGHPADLLGRPGRFLEAIHPADRGPYLAAVAGLQEGGTAEIGYRLCGPDGVYRLVRDRLRAVAGPPGGFVGCLEPLPGAPAPAAPDTAAARLLQEVLESFPDGIVMYDAAERLVLCNSAFARRHGEPPEAMIGRSLEQVCHSSVRGVVAMNGRRFDDSEQAVAWFLERFRRARREPVEIACDDGRWLLVSFYDSADGGTVLIRTDITRLKRTEASLDESAQQLRRLIVEHPLPVWLVDLADCRIVCESAAMTRLCGRSGPPRPDLQTYDHHVDRADCDRIQARLRADGRVDGYEFALRREDGQVIWVAATSRQIELDGRAMAVTSLVDLTERKQREEALREAHDTLDDAVASLSEGFALFDAEGRLVKCNEAFACWYGTSVGNMIGRGAEDICRQCLHSVRSIDGQPMDDPQRWLDWLLARMRAGCREGFEIEYADGRWLQISYQRTRRGGCVVSRTDISRLKAMDRALRESEERFRNITEAHPVAVIICRQSDGRILYASPATARLWGRPQAEIVGSSIVEYYADPAERERAQAEYRRRGKLDAYETVYRRADGSQIPVALNSRPIVYDGCDDAVVTSVFDLTELKAAQREITLQREALYQSEKLNALGTLLAGVAHELNNPLSVVVGQALLLRETVDDPKIAKRAEKIGKAADRCARIVRTFLAMARHQEPQRAPIDLCQVLEGALDITGYALRSARIEVLREGEADLPPVYADADQLNQVLTNLILNAQQAMSERPAPRRLTLSARHDRETGMVVLEVGDNGPGIPPALRPRIFEPFFTTKRAGMGTGVGLAVSRGIVESHGGSITVDASPEGGALFTIALPISTSAEAALCAAAGAARSGVGRRVLVVDDEYEVTQMLSEILVADGHRVTVAHSGNEALRRLDRERFDVILSDLHMPCLDGPGLYRRLSESGVARAARVVFITGDTLSPEIDAFLAETGLPCLDKPFTPEEIRAAVEGKAAPARSGAASAAAAG